MKEKYNDENITINILDLLFYLLKKWRSLVIMICVGAILGSVIFCYKKWTFEDSILNIENTTSFDNYEVDADVRSKMELAYRYRKFYEKQLEYNQKSLIMDMNPQEVYRGELKYYIAKSEDIKIIGEYYQNLFNNIEILEEMISVGNVDCEPYYLNEIIGCTVNSDNDSTVGVNITETNESVNCVSEDAIVIYNVSYSDEESCRKMMDVIKRYVDDLTLELKDKYGLYRCEMYNDTVCKIISNEFLNHQKNSVDALKMYADQMSSIESSFEGTDKEFYEIEYLGREQNQEVQELVFVESLFKWIVLGICVLIVCWGVFYFICYLVNGKVKCIDEVKLKYQLPILGCIDNSEVKQNFVDATIVKIQKTCNQVSNSMNYVIRSIALLPVENAMLCYEGKNEKIEFMVTELNSKYNKKFIVGNISLEEKALEKVIKQEGIILALELNKSLHSNIEKTIDICKIYDIKVLGIVVLS